MTAVINTGNESVSTPPASVGEAALPSGVPLAEQGVEDGAEFDGGLAPYLDPEAIAQEDATYREVRRAAVLLRLAARRRETAHRSGGRTAILFGSLTMAATASALAAAHKAHLAD